MRCVGRVTERDRFARIPLPPDTGVRVASGNLCEAEAPTEAALCALFRSVLLVDDAEDLVLFLTPYAEAF